MNIVISAYRCSPYDVSEAYSSFAWVDILARHHYIILFTTNKNKADIEQFYTSQNSNVNLKIFGFADNYFFSKNKFLHKEVKLGYFFFNRKLKIFLNKNQYILENADVLFHRSPQSFRYLTCLSNYKCPFVIGPLEGGLKPPPELKNYFSKEPAFFKLRNLDRLILKSKIYQKQFENASAILISLPYMLESIDEKLHSKCIWIFNTGIDCNEWKAKEPKKVNNKVVNLLFAGSLTRYKGPELIIKALSTHHLKELKYVKLHIAGSGEEEENLKTIVQATGITDRVFFHGFVSKSELKQLYESADIFVFPTLKEAAGNVLLEAMSYGLPIITMNVGGPKYICPADGAIKLPIVPFEELTALIGESIKQLIINPDLKNRMGHFNRQYCIANYDWKVIKEKVLEMFDKVF